MARFSERIDQTQPKKIIQIDSIDDKLKFSLWNVILMCLPKEGLVWNLLATYVAIDVTKTPIDLEYFDSNSGSKKWLRAKFFGEPWWLTYDILEYLFNYISTSTPDDILDFQLSPEELLEDLNEVLEQESAGYRLVNKQIVPITSASEILSIEDALSATKNTQLSGVSIHIETALEFLSKKPKSDYRNSIKESISAVEAATKLLVGSKNVGLKPALKKLSDKVETHKSLEEGFIKLYGFTSDSDGIRHSIMDQPNVDFHDAKYMLVACSAFVNYLIGKASDAGILQDNDKDS